MARTRRCATAAATVLVVGWSVAGCGHHDPTATDPVTTSTPTAGTPTPSTPPPAPTTRTYPPYPPRDYTFTLTMACFCTQAGAPMRVTVRDGKVVRATFTGEGRGVAVGDDATAEAVTIQDVIDRADDPRVARVSVVWPSGQAYPTSVSIDGSRRIADDETTYGISQVVA